MVDTNTQVGNTPTPSPKDWEAAIAYLNILFVYTAWKKSGSATHMWHAKNGAGLFLLTVGAYILFQILAFILPGGAYSTLNWILLFIDLAIVALSLNGAWNAWNGKQWNLPVVSKFAQKIPLEKWFSGAKPSVAPVVAVNPEPTPTSAPVAAPMPEPTPEPTPMPTPEPTPMPTQTAEPMEPTSTEPTNPTPPQSLIA